jgi:hypothetical protein
MKSKFAFLVLASLLLVGCDDAVPSTTIYKDGKFPPPGPVAMKYLGTAKADDANDPINGCRVYVFKVEDYIQTAVLCNGRVRCRFWCVAWRSSSADIDLDDDGE